MITCCFCKKKYNRYVVLICDDVECFAFEKHLKDIYYHNNEGICKECREKRVNDDPVFLIKNWLPVRCKIELTRIQQQEKGNATKIWEDALKRIQKLENKLEATPEIQALYRKNNPAAYKEKPPGKQKCIYCGEREGIEWINDPNSLESKPETCWWVCKACSEIIPLQEEHSMHIHMMYMAKEHGLDHRNAEEKALEAERKMRKIAQKDGTDLATFEISREDKGYKSKRLI